MLSTKDNSTIMTLDNNTGFKNRQPVHKARITFTIHHVDKSSILQYLTVDSGMGTIFGRTEENSNLRFSRTTQKSAANNGLGLGIKRSQSLDSVDNNSGGGAGDPWGWFDEDDSNVLIAHPRKMDGTNRKNKSGNKVHKTLSLPLPASNPPSYVLESTVETQQLWYETAGQRPQQPRHEREYFESLWQANFEKSNVKYPEKPSGEDENMRVDLDKGKILQRGRGPFSISVSKSFQNHYISCVTLQMPSFRVITGENGNLFAEFLVVVAISNIQSLSLGIWRRYSHFTELVDDIMASNEGTTTYRNTLLSWQCLLNKKRWFKCLDSEYLGLKCFLLERFMHDLLFESPTPELISDFLGLEE